MPRLLIASPNRNAYSETFIRAHIDHLQQVVTVLTDGAPPTRDTTGRPLVPGTMGARLWRKLSGTSHQMALRKAIADRLRKERIDVVLAEFGTAGEAIMEVCAAAGVPVVVHFHGIDAFHHGLLKEHRNYAATFAGAAAVVAVSREMEAQLLALGCPRDKLFYNCYGIDVERFSPVDPSHSGKHFTAVGRFVDKKAPHLTLLAFHRAWQQDPELRLTYAGTGPLHGSAVQLAEALGMSEAVTFTGVVAHEEVAALMARTRAFVQHSIISMDNDHEGTPLSILEAMARGLPVIATRHGGIVDVVEHDRSGLLSAEKDIASMSAHITALAQDPERAASMGRVGQAAVRQHHTRAQSIAGLQAILDRASATR